MDKALYIAMTGARHNAAAQTLHANNLANVNTTGFRADFAQARSMQVFGDAFPSRVYALTERPATDFRPGVFQETGSDLDVAIEGEGFITVDGGGGTEAFTRLGSFYVDNAGALRTTTGRQVLGDGGPIVIPPFEKMEIGKDGTISIQGQGQSPDALTQVNRIKLVNPDLEGIDKGADGLFRRKDGLIEPPANEVTVAKGFLETSNVNAVDAMTQILSLARQFELQVKMMRTAEDNAEASSRLLQVN
ncbi:MAG: flagellar basal body rod protein FlgF [Pseudomonadales bacterium]|nr:flagellar basal body rod protein FlgF [Pseudomonadales bacterium]